MVANYECPETWRAFMAPDLTQVIAHHKVLNIHPMEMTVATKGGGPSSLAIIEHVDCNKSLEQNNGVSKCKAATYKDAELYCNVQSAKHKAP